MMKLQALLVGLFLVTSHAVDWDVITDLDMYVHNDDGHFEWHEIASYNYEGVTLYIINMTSQYYQTDAFSTRPIWWHYMGIAIPDKLSRLDFATLAITGGSNSDMEPPPRQDALGLLMSRLANDTGLISAYIAQVPNGPTWFYNDPSFSRRSGDSLIAWTWRSFLDTPDEPLPTDPTMIARMPMTKSAKRGLDTITEFAKIRVPGSNIQQFAATGASKRGWTVWSLAAVDQRVVCMIPQVFSMINMDGGTLLQHNQNMDGAWSFAFEPYWNENITMDYFSPKATRLWDVEDMYRYKERFTLPILEMVSSGDEFFLLDDNHHWWNDIPDPKWLMMLPNAEHVMAPHYLQIYETMVSFILSVIQDIEIPTVSWTLGSTASSLSVHYTANPPPTVITAYYAVTLPNDTRRDFRLLSLEPGNENPWVHPVAWRHNITVEDRGNGEYHVEHPLTDGEWTGLFLEGEWEGPTGLRMVFTSQVNIAPNTYPRPPCTDGASCYGFLT